MQNWIYPFVLWLVVAYRMKSQLFRMFLFYSLLFSLTCFISTSDPLFYFGQPTSVCCRWGTMHDLSDRFPKDLFFLCDPGSIYVLVPQLWSAGTANSTVVSYLFVSFHPQVSLFNRVLPIYLELLECRMLSLLQVLVHAIPSSWNALPWE